MAPALPGLSAPPAPPTFSRRGALRLAIAVGLAAGAAACSGADGSAAPAPPWPDRPVVTLAFDVAADLRSVSGVETLVFTPDAPVTELVFRAWPNTPAGARAGNALEVTDATVDDRSVVPAVSAGGAPAGAPGTLVVLPVPGGSAPAGRAIQVRLGFRLALGAETGERSGSSPSTSTAWFATAFPLLAWVRGRGWAREPAVDMAGETVTSEEFRLAALTVGAPAGLRVLGTGSDDGPVPAPPGRTARRFHADSVRDVAVAVGDYDLTETRVGATRVHLGLPAAGTRDDADGWTRSLTRQLDGLTGLLGPFPYPDLWVAIVPTQTDGVEFPTSVQLGDLAGAQRDSLVAHELAHQWFYSLVGNNQAADPWIDESFATVAQALVTGRRDDYRLDGIRPDDRVGRPMGYWAATGGFDRYVRGVYDAGAAAMLGARDRAGPERFDAALRTYVATCAHRVVTPADVARAFAGVPEAIDALRDVGALPESTLDSADEGTGNG